MLIKFTSKDEINAYLLALETLQQDAKRKLSENACVKYSNLVNQQITNFKMHIENKTRWGFIENDPDIEIDFEGNYRSKEDAEFYAQDFYERNYDHPDECNSYKEVCIYSYFRNDDDEDVLLTEELFTCDEPGSVRSQYKQHSTYNKSQLGISR